MRRLMQWFCALALALACFAVTDASAARPTQKQREAAREHANNGRDLFKNSKYEEAIDEFRAAEDIIHAPPHLLYVARSLQKLGRLLEARKEYTKIIEEKLLPTAPKAFYKAQQVSRAERDELDQQIPKITVAIQGPALEDVTVAIDGVPVDAAVLAEPLPLDPGEHKVEAEAPGYDSDRETFELQAGEGTVAVELLLVQTGGTPIEPDGDEDEEPVDVPIPPIIVMGAGVAVLAVGGITGGLALGKADELKEACPTNPCPTENETLADDANLLATVSTVSFIVGGLATAAGAGWLIWELTADDGDDGADEGHDALGLRVRPYIGPGYAGLVGVF